ncbi:MAG: hypothetical protein ACFFAH_16965 [Promethearchaeota archaeon]
MINNQEKILDFNISSKQNLVNLILKNLSDEVNKGIKANEEALNTTIKKIVQKYQKKKSDLINIILEKLRLDF